MTEPIMLSAHFTLQEFLYSQTAARAGVKNIPSIEAFFHMQKTAAVLEVVRFICGENPITITSGYRNPEVNALVGGSSTSAHMSGWAADFIVPCYGDPIDVCRAIQPYLPLLKVDQLIHEYGDWVHLGLCSRSAVPRNQCLTIDENGTHDGF